MKLLCGVFVVTMICCQLGIAVVETLKRSWRTAFLGLLFAIANTVIFWPKGK